MITKERPKTLAKYSAWQNENQLSTLIGQAILAQYKQPLAIYWYERYKLVRFTHAAHTPIALQIRR